MDVLKPQFATLSEEHRYKYMCIIHSYQHLSFISLTNKYLSVSFFIIHLSYCSTLLDMYKQLQAERDNLDNELKRMKGTATPRYMGCCDWVQWLCLLWNGFACRPFWSKCAEFVHGGPDKWAELSKGRSSNELVDVLLAEISGLDINEIAVGDLFQAQVGGSLVITIHSFQLEG